MELNIFKNNEERAQARAVLKSLKDHPGWQFLVRAFDLNIEHFNQELRDKRDFTSIEEVYRLQDQLTDLEHYRNLPDVLIDEATDGEPAKEESDIYE